MARVTIEDCIEKIGSHFKVVQIASHRAHQLELGAKTLVDKENDKPVVIALREIAEGKIDESILSKPLAEKEPWDQTPGLMSQSDDIGQEIADIDSHSDIHEVDPDADKSEQTQSNPTTDEDDINVVQELNFETDEESEADKV